MSMGLAPARAAASRRNGAKSRGPKTAQGKARSAQNALRHGLCAQKFVVLGDEDAQAYAALEAAVLEELAPDGIVQRLLAGRVARAAWRVERAERIESELFEFRQGGEDNLALALIRDGNGTRSFETLMRYRGSALAEFYRALRTLKALQDEAGAARDRLDASGQQPNEPERRAIPGATRPGDDQSSLAVLVAAEVTRQILLPTSSATSSAPWPSIATPTGRPSASSSALRKPVSTSTGSPSGRPSANGTKMTL
jgi:hypothetical protein